MDDIIRSLKIYTNGQGYTFICNSYETLQDLEKILIKFFDDEGQINYED